MAQISMIRITSNFVRVEHGGFTWEDPASADFQSPTEAAPPENTVNAQCDIYIVAIKIRAPPSAKRTVRQTPSASNVTPNSPILRSSEPWPHITPNTLVVLLSGGGFCISHTTGASSCSNLPVRTLRVRAYPSRCRRRKRPCSWWRLRPATATATYRQSRHCAEHGYVLRTFR